MKDLTKIYIDLSKCTEEQRKYIISLLPESLISSQYKIFSHFKFLCYERAMRMWIVTSIEVVCSRTELTYPEFIKLFEGGEDYPGKRYQPLFDHLNQEHGLILHESEMDEIIRIVGGLNSNQ